MSFLNNLLGRIKFPRWFPSLGPIGRITIGLVSLSLSLLIGFEVVFGLFPKETDAARQLRQKVSQSLAVQATIAIQGKDFLAANRLLTALVERDDEFVSIGLRKADGTLRAQAGSHVTEWTPVDPTKSTLEFVSIPIFDETGVWGRLEIRYRPVGARTATQWINTPSIKLFGVFLVSASVVFYLYLRRVLQRLDPSSAVPDRVRLAFDTLTEGLLILDGSGRIMMANRSLLSVANSLSADLIGKTPDQLPWLKRVNSYSKQEQPWSLAVRERRVVAGIEYSTRAIGGRNLRLIANYAPVLDGNNAIRGCMVTFNDVTEIERANEKLMEALTDLAANKEAIQSKNNELERLASRDALTGCFNRRVFFERFGILFKDARSRGLELACIMGDIDKFKLINDTHGHQVGDQVIQSFAGILQGAVRGEDLVGRYGGEEFCIVLVGANLEVAMRLAERIRRTVELECGAAVNNPSALGVTCSLGVSSIRLAAADPASMVNQADQALYYAKQNGRNRVISFGRLMEAVV